MLLVQAGCSSEPENKKTEPKSAATEVTQVASSDTAAAQLKEPAVPEGSASLRAAPTRPAWNMEKSSSKDVLVPEAAQPEKSKSDLIAPKGKTVGSSVYAVKKGDTISKIAKAHKVSVSALMKENNLTMTSRLKIGQELSIPGGAAVAAEVSVSPVKTAAPAANMDAGELDTYVVQKGDSLSRIASRHGTTVAHLMEVNSLKSHNIRVGQKLRVNKGSLKSAPKAESKVSAAAEPAHKKTAAVSSAKAAEGEVLYTVKNGDYLGSIAKKYKTSVKSICELNGIKDPRKVRVGQTLKIKASGEAAKAAKTEAPIVVEDKPKTAEPAAPVSAPSAETAAPTAPAPTATVPALPQPEAPKPEASAEDNIPVVNL